MIPSETVQNILSLNILRVWNNINTIAANSWTRFHRLWVFRNWLGQGRGCPKDLSVLRLYYKRKCCLSSLALFQPRIVVPKVLPNFCGIRIGVNLHLRKKVGKNDPNTRNQYNGGAYPVPSLTHKCSHDCLSLVLLENSYLLTISKVFFHLFVQNKHLKQHKEKHG